MHDVSDINWRKLVLPTLVPIIVMLIAMFWRPVWRDDVWALFMSEPSIGLSGVFDRSSTNVHPPVYFYILHIWRLLIDAVWFSKALNLVILAVGIWATLKLGKPRLNETKLFLIISAGSYWVIYFAAETRPYTLMFVLCTLIIFTAARLVETPKHKSILPLALLFAILSAAATLTHYFNFIWVSILGFVIGLHFLLAGRTRDFFIIGCASVCAVLPGLAFLYFINDKMGIPPSDPMTLSETFGHGLNQFQRGFTTKLFGSNLIIAILFFMGIAALLRRQERMDYVIGGAIILTVLAIFTLHLTWQPLIKERSFMIIMPAMILLMTRAVLYGPQGKWRSRMLRALPWVIAITPILFIGEYFKDREKMSDVRNLIDVAECEDAKILTHYRPAPEGEGFNAYYTRLSLKNLPIQLVDSATARAPASSACPVKAIALQLPRGEKGAHIAARNSLREAGLDLDQLEEVSIGKGRNLIYIEKQ